MSRSPQVTRETPIDEITSSPLGLAVHGNMIGGLTLVTLFRLLQVPDKVLEPDTQR